MATLSDLASVFRSKNADPFLTTIDIYFPGPAEYHHCRAANVLTTEAVAGAYRIPEEAVYGIFFADALHVAKVTIYKYAGGDFAGLGDPGVGDMFGAQQHVPLLDLPVPDAG